MPDPTEPAPVFPVGTRVRVKPGTPSDYPDIPLGGWTGTVRDIGPAIPRVYLVAFDTRTLVQVNAVYRKRCERDGFSATEYAFREGDLVPDTGDPPVIEQPTRIESRPLDFTHDDDGVRLHLGLTTDEAVGGQVRSALLEDYLHLFARVKPADLLRRMYPALADWAENHGTIEIGCVGEGGVVRLRSRTRVAFEGVPPRSFGDALRALEAALTCDVTQLAAPVVLDRAWLTPTVVALAQQIDGSGDFAAMPVLADALQDAGCDHAEVLDHCRGPAAHKRDCWVIGVILGRP